MLTESIGLDVGSDTLKLVQLFADKSDPEIRSIAQSEIKHSSSTESLASSIDSLLKSSHIQPNNIRIAVSGPSVIVRYVKMPIMSKDELKSAIIFEAEKCIPYPIDEVYIDYIVQNESTDKPQLTVMIVAAKKVMIDKVLVAMDVLNITPLSINLDALATVNAFFYSKISEEAKGKMICLLNMGAKHTNLNVVQDRQTYFLRDIQVAGNDIGEQVKKNLSTLATGSDNFSIDSNDFFTIYQKASKMIGTEELESILKLALRNLLDELRLSFGYCENQYGIIIEEAFISGGIAKSDSVIGILQKSLGVQLTRWNPFDNCRIGESVEEYSVEDATQYAVSLGLALEGVG